MLLENYKNKVNSYDKKISEYDKNIESVNKLITKTSSRWYLIPIPSSRWSK